jgi:hypothetical protein
MVFNYFFSDKDRQQKRRVNEVQKLYFYKFVISAYGLDLICDSEFQMLSYLCLMQLKRSQTVVEQFS